MGMVSSVSWLSVGIFQSFAVLCDCADYLGSHQHDFCIDLRFRFVGGIMEKKNCGQKCQY